MKAVDIIKIACDFTGNEDVRAAIESQAPLTEQQQGVVDCLVKCINLVQNEVATEYLPIEMVEEVEAKDFKVDYSAFSKQPISIIWAKDRFGRNIRFKPFADHLVIFAGRAKVKYYACPDKITSSDQQIEQPLLPARIYAYGVAREYLLMQNLGDESDIFEMRFKDSLAVFARKKREVRLPARRWN